MRKPVIVGALLVLVVGYSVSSCSGNKSPNNGGGGGASNTGGSSSVGGGTADKDSGADSGSGECSNPNPREYDPDGGLTRVGNTDPSSSLKLDVGAYYAMPSTSLHGHCYTIADNFVPDGSSIYPPCGDTGPCFTVDTGLCTTSELGIASGSSIWGAGIGCNLAQNQGSTYVGRADVTGKTSITVAVYGCKVPAKLQVQINMHYGTGPALVDGGALSTGYFCKVADVPKADASGIHTITVPLTDLTENCWDPGNPHFDPQTMQIEAAAIQINSDPSARTKWDFCVSKLSID